ncbi:MAG: hypothetical protein JWN34_1082 [Bryobacterales bacterium]|nr:hypothetical protein [Bryobacterales bacterium]
MRGVGEVEALHAEGGIPAFTDPEVAVECGVEVSGPLNDVASCIAEGVLSWQRQGAGIEYLIGATQLGRSALPAPFRMPETEGDNQVPDMALNRPWCRLW